MKKRFSKIIICAVLCFGMLTTGIPVHATQNTTNPSNSSTVTPDTLAELQNRVAQTQQAIDRISSQQQKNNETRSELMTEQQDLQAKYDNIKAQADAVNTQMAVAQSNITSLNEAMESLSMELDTLETEEEKRYSDMEKRIQYFYENHYGESAITIFCESNSLHEALDSFQNVGRIMEYDRNCLEEMQKTQEDIKSKQKEIGEKQADIQAYQQTLNTSVEQLNKLKDAAADALSDKNEELAILNVNDAQYAQEISILQQRYDSEKAQEANAQMQLAMQISLQISQNISGGTEYTGGAISTGTDEVLLLAATIQGEAWNQPYEGKLAVGSVIANRVKSQYFPNTITGVITAPRQFEAYSCGLVNKYLQAGVDATCLEIAQKVVAGTRNGNWLFFMTKPWADHFGITGYQLIGDHAFFRVWGNNSGQDFSKDVDNTPINTTTVDPSVVNPTPDANQTNTDSTNASGASDASNDGNENASGSANASSGANASEDANANGGDANAGGGDASGNQDADKPFTDAEAVQPESSEGGLTGADTETGADNAGTNTSEAEE